jgi:thymidylate synthase
MNFDTSLYTPFGSNTTLCLADTSFPNNIESQYLRNADEIMRRGLDMGNRTDTPARDIFRMHMQGDLSKGFPLLTTKKLFTRAIIYELLWFLKGDTNIKYLKDHGVKIWDEWADENGNLGPVYGRQWRDFGGVDQITWVIDRIKSNPECRRQIVSAWNVPELADMALMPCHVLFQFRVQAGRLSVQLYQRSADWFLGVPFNIASYALLLHMVADVCGLEVGEFIWAGGSCHIYANHFDQIKLQLSQTQQPFPTLKLKHRESIFDFEYEDFEFINYNHGPLISAPISK